MAVFFRITKTKDRIAVEIKIGFLKKTIYISMESDGISIVAFKRKYKLYKSNDGCWRFNLSDIREYIDLFTIIKSSIKAFFWFSKDNGVFLINTCYENGIIIHFAIFENSKQLISSQNTNFLHYLCLFDKTGFQLKFSIIPHLKGIFTLLFNILKARRKRYGSKL